MIESEEYAPAIREVLASARRREPPADGVLDVDARSVPAALSAAEDEGRVPIVAEVKPTSPTTDGVRDADPAALAAEMVDNGATAISVLTEPEHFDGSAEALRRVRETVDVPVLRKDFVLTEGELDRVAADAVLLVARFVEDLPGLIAAARDRGFQLLVEAHTRSEVEAAVEADADLVGINNRDLARLDVDLGTFERVAPAVPDGVTTIAESGVRNPADVRRMRSAGADGLLVGSAIMDGDVGANTRELVRA